MHGTEGEEADRKVWGIPFRFLDSSDEESRKGEKKKKKKKNWRPGLSLQTTNLKQVN